MFQHKKVHFVCIQNESRGKIEGEKGLLSRTCRPGQNLGTSSKVSNTKQLQDFPG